MAKKKKTVSKNPAKKKQEKFSTEGLSFDDVLKISAQPSPKKEK